MKKIFILYFALCSVLASAQSADKNYIRIRTYSDTLSLDEIRYFDGLGSLTQDVQSKITPLGNDLVSLHYYDYAGREKYQYLPGISDGNGNYGDESAVKMSANNLHANNAAPFTTYINEPSSLNRLQEVYSPGTERLLHQKSVKNIYSSNASSGIMACSRYLITGTGMHTTSLKKDSIYGAGQLDVTQTTDEDDHILLTFKNTRGDTILERRVLSDSNYADTYYLYDPLGNLCIVLPPMASSSLIQNNIIWSDTDVTMRAYAYIYEYDEYNRCVKEKRPGAEWIYYTYDKAGHRLFKQDGELRKNNQWSFTLYDACGRETISGICMNTDIYNYSNAFVYTTFSLTDGYANTGYVLNNLSLSSPQILSIHYYDTYSYLFLPSLSTYRTSLTYTSKRAYEQRQERLSSGVDIAAYGLHTGQRVFLLDGSNKEVASSTYYNYRNYPIQILSTNHFDNGYEKEYINYTITGKRTRRLHEHSDGRGHVYTEEYTYTYDRAERLKSIQHILGNNSPVILANYVYDELGRLKSNERNGQSNLVTSYTYNGQSLLKSSGSSLFSETLFYNDLYGNSTPCYNGNISAMNWWISGDKTRGYLFSYDNLSRLTAAGYMENGTSNSNYSTSYAYDKQGNITALTRRGATGTTTYGMIDNLTMAYSGNQLVKADDSGENVNLSASMDFKDGSKASTEYFYDSNGNLIKDLNKGITSITYNLLNLPQTLAISNSFGSATNTYTYSADGRKLRMLQQGSGSTKQIDYCGNMIYENGTLKRILVDGGYIENGTYYYYLPDHQGNVRVVANSDGSVVQTNHYYPFGMSFTEGNVTSNQPYKYNGKELDAERGLNWYDYGARMYDPALGRWHVADLMEGVKPWTSGYMYCLDNPERYVDPTGLYDTESDALKYAKEHSFAQVLQDTQTGKWFVSMDESGTNPYTSGGTVTRYFGPENESSPNLTSSLNIGLSAWNVTNTAKTEMFNWAVRDYSHLNYNEFKALDKGAQAIKAEEALGEVGAKYLKAVKVLGNVSGYVTFGISAYNAYRDPTMKNMLQAGVNFSLIVFRVNPIINVGMTIMDLTGGSDYIYGKMDNGINQIIKR